MKSVTADQSSWGKIRATGEDRLRFLQGMCTANIDELAEGGWTRAAILNVKGRVMSMIEIVRRAEDVLILCEPEVADRTVEILDKHIIMDEVELERIELPLHRVWHDVEAVWSAPPVFEPPEAPSPAEEVEVRRVEAGMPRYGVDVTEDNFPFESLLSRYVDYEKGCYIGQEPVYRVYSKGQAAKVLRGLSLEGGEPAPVGEKVDHPDKAGAGTVTSAVVSPEFGSIALAYLHRKAWEPGGTVTVAGRDARVVELPFGGA